MIEAQDVLVSIDGRDVRGEPFVDVLELLKGTGGSAAVDLVFLRRKAAGADIGAESGGSTDAMPLREPEVENAANKGASDEEVAEALKKANADEQAGAQADAQADAQAPPLPSHSATPAATVAVADADDDAPAAKTPQERMQALSEMKEYLSEEEFDAKKKEILASL